jgi:pimeloyl-ACP methyl ester carboxylesterase
VASPPAEAAAFVQAVATTPDDLGLTYRIYGTSGPYLVCTNGLGVSTFFWELFASAFADRYRVVVWDFVGHGRSSDPSDPARATIVSFAEDLATVMDAAGVDRAVLLGHSLGAQVNFEFYRKRADRVLALVPTLGTYGRAVETFFGQPILAVRLAKFARDALPKLHRLIPAAMDPLVQSTVLERGARLLRIVDPKSPPMQGYFEHLARLDYQVFAHLLGDLLTHDAGDVLPTVHVPTLVVGAERDMFVPLFVARRMVELIPGAELLVLPGTHAALFEQADLFHDRMERFLRERVFPRSALGTGVI